LASWRLVCAGVDEFITAGHTANIDVIARKRETRTLWTVRVVSRCIYVAWGEGKQTRANTPHHLTRCPLQFYVVAAQKPAEAKRTAQSYFHSKQTAQPHPFSGKRTLQPPPRQMRHTTTPQELKTHGTSRKKLAPNPNNNVSRKQNCVTAHLSVGLVGIAGRGRSLIAAFQLYGC
jgi:hypothetical protein